MYRGECWPTADSLLFFTRPVNSVVHTQPEQRAAEPQKQVAVGEAHGDQKDT